MPCALCIVNLEFSHLHSDEFAAMFFSSFLYSLSILPKWIHVRYVVSYDTEWLGIVQLDEVLRRLVVGRQPLPSWRAQCGDDVYVLADWTRCVHAVATTCGSAGSAPYYFPYPFWFRFSFLYLERQQWRKNTHIHFTIGRTHIPKTLCDISIKNQLRIIEKYLNFVINRFEMKFVTIWCGNIGLTHSDDWNIFRFFGRWISIRYLLARQQNCKGLSNASTETTYVKLVLPPCNWTKRIVVWCMWTTPNEYVSFNESNK